APGIPCAFFFPGTMSMHESDTFVPKECEALVPRGPILRDAARLHLEDTCQELGSRIMSAIGLSYLHSKKSGETPVTKPVAPPVPASVFEALGRYDTPTICNAMEVVAPERRLIGYTVKPLVCPFPDLPPMVGYARTVAIRSVIKSGLPAAEQAKRRIDYYEYVGTGFGPRITVIEDIDGADVGYGAFWGEVQSNVHKALGCLGVITDGSIRDIPQWAPGFQALAGSIGPSHAWVHAESFGGEVRVAGMTVKN